MKLDHAEFISRHHKPDQPARATYAPPRFNIWALAFASFAYITFCLAVVSALDVDVTVLIVLVILFLGAFFGIYALQKILRLFSPQEKERALFKEILEASHSARMITDGANNAIITNSRFENMCRDIGPPGYDSLVKIFAANDEALAHFRGLADQAHRGLTDSIELRLDKGDHHVWMMVTAQPIPGWAGYIHWRLDDITERYERNRQVREEREKLIDFTDNAPVGFFSVDGQGRFVFVNATLARWVGEDIQTMLNHGRLHSYLADPPQNAAPFDIKEGGGIRQVGEIRMKGPGGAIFLASINQGVVYEADGRVRTRGVVHDLTAERAMRQALEASEVRFRKFFEEAPLGILIVGSDMVVEDCNDVLANMLDMKPDEVEGQSFSRLVDKDDWSNVASTLNRIQRERTLVEPVEIRLWSVGQNLPVPARMYARKFSNSDHILLHFIDLTQQKSLESQFIQSQKMQAVGQLAGGIAHDFNNLLTAIIGFCDLLLLRHKPGDPSFGDLQQIKQNSNRAANLVRQLLAFSRQQTLRPKVQDITDILTEIAHLLRRLMGANIELKLVHGSDLGFVKVDGGQMEQVLVNLAVNGRDAMPDGGTLTITTSHFVILEPLKIGEDVMPAGHWVRIDVGDTGTGIPPEIVDRIFEPFFTTKDVGQGTGLGLATVYGIIRQTGGYLSVDSEVGKGTTLSIYLPRLTEIGTDEEKSAVALEENVSDLTGTARILLVEDEDAVRTFSTRALTNKGYEVETAESGEAGLQVFKNLKKPIDLLITDVIMPNMDGPTLAKKIREDVPKLKIIFISGYTEDKLKDHMGEGIYFLPKPFTLKQLAAKVKEVMDD
jgi:two-component system cell cycle sensor histidine kinase/response regulator CckA